MIERVQALIAVILKWLINTGRTNRAIPGDYRPRVQTSTLKRRKRLPPKIDNQNFKSVWPNRNKMCLVNEIEREYLYIFDWSTDVIDIREQYPLIDEERQGNIED